MRRIRKRVRKGRRTPKVEWTKRVVMEELVNHFGTNMRNEDLYTLVEEIEETLDLDRGRWSNYGECGTVTVDGVEYNIIPSEDEAEEIATEYVREMLEEEPELFDPGWLAWYVEVDLDPKKEAEEFVAGMTDEEVLEHAGMEDEPEKVEEARERLIEEYTDLYKDRFRAPYEYFTKDLGYSPKEFFNAPFVRVDIDSAAKDAVYTDGWAHFLSEYDGNYETTEGGLVIFRE